MNAVKIFKIMIFPLDIRLPGEAEDPFPGLI